ncbi:MAG: MFS transporter [Spirochaetia bacterium]|jgi:DHA1 family multidrug resistance protein-like MFS transporter/DHA1 family quinolone resistance protein-like MFS transporter|nr:MFS transporter [Spirochaetia bacterium]
MELSRQRIDTVQLGTLMLLSVITELAINMVNLDFVYHFRTMFNMPAGLIGIAVGLAAISYCIACIALASFYERHRPRNVILVGLIGLVVVMLLIAWCTSLPLIWPLLVLYGFAQSMIWPSIEAWLSRGKEGKPLNQAISKFNFSWSLGAGIAPYVCTLLVERNTKLPFFTAAALFLSISIFLFVASIIVPQIRTFDSEKVYVGKAAMQDRSTILRYFCWVGVFVGYVALTGVQTVFPLYAGEVLGWTESTTGILLLIRGIVSCAVFMLLGQTEFWHFKFRYIILSQMAIAGLLLVFNGVTSFGLLIVFFFLLGIFYAFLYVESIFHGASGSVNRSRRMVIHEVVLNIGIIVGGALGGDFYDRFDYPSMMLIFSAILAIVCMVQLVIFLLKRKKKV